MTQNSGYITISPKPPAKEPPTSSSNSESTNVASASPATPPASPAKPLRPLLFPLTSENATALRARLPWPNPTPLGTRTSFGFGDRMGSATPGHIHALRAADPNGIIAPILAQQSVRENTRTGRTP